MRGLRGRTTSRCRPQSHLADIEERLACRGSDLHIAEVDGFGQAAVSLSEFQPKSCKTEGLPRQGLVP